MSISLVRRYPSSMHCSHVFLLSICTNKSRNNIICWSSAHRVTNHPVLDTTGVGCLWLEGEKLSNKNKSLRLPVGVGTVAQEDVWRREGEGVRGQDGMALKWPSAVLHCASFFWLAFCTEPPPSICSPRRPFMYLHHETGSITKNMNVYTVVTCPRYAKLVTPTIYRRMESWAVQSVGHPNLPV